MKYLFLSIFFILSQSLFCQNKKEVYIALDKELKGNLTVLKDSISNQTSMFSIDYITSSDYIYFSVLNKNIIDRKSIKSKILKASRFLETEPKSVEALLRNKKVFVIEPKTEKSKNITVYEVNVEIGFYSM